MELGDLVWLDPKQFYEHDEHVGIVIDIETTPDGYLLKVAWDDYEIAWFHESELVKVYEDR